MANFSGTLNQNAVYTALYNAYRLVTTIGDNLAGLDASNAELYKMEGGQFEDQLVWTFCDILKSYEFDPTDTNVLAPGEKIVPAQQAMKIDQVRQISLYTPTSFLSKQAFMSPSYFDQFQSVVGAQVGNTRKLYDQRLVDTYIGTTETNIGMQAQNVTLSAGDTESDHRMNAQAIAEKIANLFVDMKDSTRDFNDKGYMVSTPKEKLTIYWNANYYNKILKTDLPTIYHKDGILEDGKILPARYFGTKGTGTTPTQASSNTTIRSLVEKDIYSVTSGMSASNLVGHVYPGDLIPNTGYYIPNETYTVNANVICKIIGSDAVKYISAVETESEFWNAKNSSTNRYLTFMYGNPDRLAVRPWVTLKKV